MQQDSHELRSRRNDAARSSARWLIGGFAATIVTTLADTIQLWRKAGGDWKKFLKFRNPVEILKTPAIAAGYVVAFGSLAMSYFKAKEIPAFQDGITEVAKRDYAPETEKTSDEWRTKIATEQNFAQTAIQIATMK